MGNTFSQHLSHHGDYVIRKASALLVLTALAAHAQGASPTKAWPTTTLQAAGINRAVVDSIVNVVAPPMMSSVFSSVRTRESLISR